MRPVLVILNPNASGGRGARVAPRLERALEVGKVPYTLRITEAPGHAREIAREFDPSGSSRILVVGGDGTIHEVATGLLSRRTATGSRRSPSHDPPPPEIAVLPVGTGNDFHRMVRAPGGVDQAVRLLREGVPRRFEVGEVRWDGGRGHFVNLLGVGIDVEVLRRRDGFRRLPGLFQYLAALLSALRHYRPVALEIVLSGPDGSKPPIQVPVLLSAVTVGPSVGGGFVLAPAATPDDGLLDLFVVRTLGLVRVARYLPGILRGRTMNRPEIWQMQGTAVEIRSLDGRGFDFELDGELMEASTPFLKIRVRPDSLRILELPEGL
ncbi:MAG: diacylglycerol kinase family protein, partial [Gemmatimonadota bacterium]